MGRVCLPTCLQGVFSFNLTLAEIKTLRAKQRVNIRHAAAQAGISCLAAA